MPWMKYSLSNNKVFRITELQPEFNNETEGVVEVDECVHSVGDENKYDIFVERKSPNLTIMSIKKQ